MSTVYSLLLVILSSIIPTTHAKIHSTPAYSGFHANIIHKGYAQTIETQLAPTSVPPTPSPTLTPQSVAQTQTQTQTQQKEPSSPSSSPGGLLIAEINNFRSTKELSPVSTRSDVCDFAQIRAKEISQNFNHDGFSNRLSSNSLPFSYTEIAENIAMNSDEKSAFQSWVDSGPHNANMQKNTPFVCVGREGNYYAYVGIRP